MENTEEMEDQVRRLTRTVDEMRERMAALEAGEPKQNNGSGPSSRRGFLRLGAAAALGAVGWAAAKVVPASAATGGTFTLGQANLAENPTTIAADGGTPPVQVLAAKDATFIPADLAAAGGFLGTLQGLGAHTGVVEGVDGWAQGAQAFGVYGLTDSGTGVVGESNTGIGLYARGSGRIRQEPRALAGMPNYTANDVEQVRDLNGELWISVPASVNAVGWKRLATLELFPNPRRIYDGYLQPTAPGTYGPIDATAQVSTSNWPGGVSGVPAGARHAFCAVQSYNAGVMTLFPDLTADPNVANWASTVDGPLNLTYVLVPLSPAGKFKIHTYFTGQKFIDVWGFYM
jgi:hypothetical protein